MYLRVVILWLLPHPPPHHCTRVHTHTHTHTHTGELLSVAPWVVRQVPSLFALSERVLLAGYWEYGFFSLTAVGAYNVGSIEVDIDEVHMVTGGLGNPLMTTSNISCGEVE